MVAIYLLLGVFIGLLFGVIGAYIFINKKHVHQLKLITTDLESKLVEESNKLRSSEGDVLIKSEQLNIKSTQLEGKIEELKLTFSKLDIANNELNNWKNRTAVLDEKLSRQKEEIVDLQDKFSKEFRLIANQILEEKTEKFTIQNSVSLKQILDPFNEKIKDFSKRVETTYTEGAKDRSAIVEQIKSLTDLNGKMQLETRNLTNALKHDNKVQGNWGEVVLERILESSGLVKNDEYETQFHTKNSEGHIIKPDVIVKLPENKHIVIDSKVSLTAYESFANAETEEDRGYALKRHMDSVKSHIKLLSEKNYQNGEGLNAPDFVLLFIPIESSFSSAVQADKDIFNYAWDKKIVLVSPSTLLATLRTIASVWKQEKQNKNAQEIARQAGALYDKFIGFLKDMDNIEKGISSLSKNYDSAMNKLSTGTGNLVRKTEQLRALGAKSNKTMPNKFDPFLNESDSIE